MIAFTFALILTVNWGEFHCSVAVKENYEILPWWKSMTIYNVYPKSFKDSNGDGIGDFNGITEKLQHIVDLGIDVLWLNPFYMSPGFDHGYDISNFTAVDPIFGTMNDLSRLIREAKKLGLKFMIDFVGNHCSDQHVWFEKSVQKIEPYTDYFIWKDPNGYDRNGKPSPPNNWGNPYFGSSWTWVESRKQFYYHIFTEHQPDLNLRNPLVVEELKNVLRFWFDKGVSGLRVDAPFVYFEDEDLHEEVFPDVDDPMTSRIWEQQRYMANLPESYQLLGELKNFVKEEYTSKDGEERVFIAEVYSSLKNTLKWLDYINLAFNFELQFISPAANATVFDRAMNLWRGAVSTYVIDTHDFTRTAFKFGEEFVDIMHMIMAMLPGNLCIYYGQEIGMTGMTMRPDQRKENTNIVLTRDAVRTPMQWDDSLNAGFTTKRKPWLPVNPNYWRVNVEKETQAKVSHYQVLKSLMKLRKTPTSKYGQLKTYVLSEWVWAFTRTFENAEIYVVVVNIGTETEIIDLSVIPYLPPYLKILVSTINAGYKPGDYILSKAKFKHWTTLPPKSGLTLSTNIQRERNSFIAQNIPNRI